MNREAQIIQAIEDFLPCTTPQSWLVEASRPENRGVLLIDHANCEKKAAATAMSLIWRHTGEVDLLQKMSQLAREELLHFEQVCGFMRDRDIEYVELTASRYAAGLRAQCRTHEPARLIDTLLVGAIVEARSCERFHALAPYIEGDDPQLAKYYRSLLRAEGRHFEDYLSLAIDRAGAQEVQERLSELHAVEKSLVQSGDSEFRFHSGPIAA